MSRGKPSAILWRFSLPLLISVIFQQLYNIADSVVAGQFAGDAALAAVGASYPVTMIFMAFATGSNIGVSVVVSQLFGAKEYEQMKTAINTALISIIGLGAILTAGGLLTSRLLLAVLSTPSEIFADAVLYLNVYILGMIFLSLYNICTGIFTALGDSRTPLYFLIASSLGNIALDVLFVAGFNMGVAGVAWATFLAQGVASLLAFFTLLRRVKALPHEGCPKRFSGRMLSRIAVVAIPSILQQAFISVGNLFIQRLVNDFGADVIAGYSGAIKLNTFAVTGFTALANGLSTFSAQNVGAGTLSRVPKGFRAGLVMVMCFAVPVALLFCLGNHFVMGLFVESGSSPAVISAGGWFLRIVAPFYPVVAVKLIADSVLRGAGRMSAFMITTFSDLILRVVLAFLFSGPFGSTGIWMSWPVGWGIAAIMSVVFYASGLWRKGHVSSEEDLRQAAGK